MPPGCDPCNPFNEISKMAKKPTKRKSNREMSPDEIRAVVKSEKVNLLPEFRPALQGADRLTVVIQVHHQHEGENPVSSTASFSRFLESQEQPYFRRYKIGENWKDVDFGWVESASYFVVENRAGAASSQLPSEEEKEELAKMILEVAFESFENTPWEILPGESIPLLMPRGSVKIKARSQYSEIPASVTAFPK
jgi:hypothetical protein